MLVYGLGWIIHQQWWFHNTLGTGLGCQRASQQNYNFKLHYVFYQIFKKMPMLSSREELYLLVIFLICRLAYSLP